MIQGSDIITNLFFYFPFYLLVFARMFGMLATAPLFSNSNIPMKFKVGLACFMAIIFLPALSPIQQSFVISYNWVIIFIAETLIGMAMGFVANLAFYSVVVAGQFVDLQMGFGFANVLDPQLGIQVPIMGNFNQIIAMLIFLIINGHHWLILGVMRSYEVLPLGTYIMSSGFIDLTSKLIANFFIIAFQISLPVVGALALSDICMGIIAKTMPQMNVFVIGMPMKILIGFFILMFTMPLFVSSLYGVFEHAIDDMIRLAASLAG